MPYYCVKKWQIAFLSYQRVISIWKRWSIDKTVIDLSYCKVLWFFSVLRINYFPQLSASSTYWFAHRQITVFCSTSCNNCSFSKAQWMAKQDTILKVTQLCQLILMPTWCKTGHNKKALVQSKCGKTSILATGAICWETVALNQFLGTSDSRRRFRTTLERIV